jgi:hypothetical protein
MEGYIAQLIAQCATASANATKAPKKQPPPWLAELNKTRNNQTGIEDGLVYCHNIVAGIEKRSAEPCARLSRVWYGQEIRR